MAYQWMNPALLSKACLPMWLGDMLLLTHVLLGRSWPSTKTNQWHQSLLLDTFVWLKPLCASLFHFGAKRQKPEKAVNQLLWLTGLSTDDNNKFKCSTESSRMWIELCNVHQLWSAFLFEVYRLINKINVKTDAGVYSIIAEGLGAVVSFQYALSVHA